MRASIRQVAELAQVSPKTVTNVLHDRSARTSDATRLRVMEAVRHLNYIPVRTCVQNRRSETRVLGLYFADTDVTQHTVGTASFHGIQREAEKHGYDLLILGARPHWAAEREEMRFLDRRSDGFIFVNAPKQPDVLNTLVQNAIPAVMCYTCDVPPAIPFVMPDDADAMRQAVQLLARRGHRVIAHFAGAERHTSACRRRVAFSNAMRAAGLGRYADLVVHGDWNDEQVTNRQAVGQILELRPTAVVCGNDVQAALLCETAIASGLRVPEDLSIVGMDNMAEAQRYGITTLNNPFVDIGRTAVEVLLRLLAGEDALCLNRELPVTLIERDSVAGPRN